MVRCQYQEDLSVSFDTVERWVQILERLFFVYRIIPFGSLKIRAVKKEKKLYFWNWSFVENEGARWENIDFVIIKNSKPIMGIECKTGERQPTSCAGYFRERTSISEFYQVHRGTRDFENAKKDIRVLPFTKFCAGVLPFTQPPFKHEA